MQLILYSSSVHLLITNGTLPRNLSFGKIKSVKNELTRYRSAFQIHNFILIMFNILLHPIKRNFPDVRNDSDSLTSFWYKLNSALYPGEWKVIKNLIN